MLLSQLGGPEAEMGPGVQDCLVGQQNDRGDGLRAELSGGVESECAGVQSGCECAAADGAEG